MRHTRRTIRVAGAILVVGLAAGAWRAVQILAIGIAYKAKILCSGVFVSGRSPDAVLAELETDDLALLRHLRATVDITAGSVTASALGLVRRTAVYREGLGCALALDGLSPPRMPAPGLAQFPTASEPMQRGPATRELDAVVARAFAEPDSRRPRRTLAVVVVQDGRVVSERYAPGISAGTALAGWSMTKSVMNALIGILVGRGLLTLDGPVPIPEWSSPGDPRAGITLDSLLRMSSGLEFDEDLSSPRSDVMRMMLDAGDTAKLAIDKDLVAPPGASWQYSSGTSGILARVIRNVVHDDARYLDYPRRALFDRVGMSSAVIETDASGTFVGSSYMYATARDWARFGTLYLQNGVWNGERVLPEGWVGYSTTPAPADSGERYGAHFWLRIPEEYRGSNQQLPSGTYHAVGHEAQFVTIVPSRDVVIVRLGHTRYPEAWDHAAFVADVIDALGEDRGRRAPEWRAR
jgi:CubicO group peptidase (beta-lactamase class C family)